jgi:hypothetical protein
MKAITPSFIWDPHEQLEPRSESLIQAGVGAILTARRIFPATIAAVSIMIAIALFGTVKFQSAITLGLIFLFTRGKLASETGTSVLVHCEMGVSRSATVCISCSTITGLGIRHTFTSSSGGRVLIRTKDFSNNSCYGSIGWHNNDSYPYYYYYYYSC